MQLLETPVSHTLPPPRSSGPQAQEISFQQFKTDLLKKELVARLEVANGDMVKVFIKQETGLEGAAPEQAGNYKYYFLIGEGRRGCGRMCAVSLAAACCHTLLLESESAVVHGTCCSCQLHAFLHGMPPQP
jgi:hypothetical protein